MAAASDPPWRVARFVRRTSLDDDTLIRDLLVHVSKEDLRLRFFDSIKEFSHQFIAKLTDLDCLRAIAFVAFDEASNETLGVVWLYCDSVHETGEYAILLRSDLKGRGLPPLLSIQFTDGSFILLVGCLSPFVARNGLVGAV